MEQSFQGTADSLTRQCVRWRDVPRASRRMADEAERIGFGSIICQLDADLQPKWSPPPRVRRRVGMGRPKVRAGSPRDLDAIPKAKIVEMLDAFASGEPDDWVSIDVQDGLPVNVEVLELAKS